MNDLSGNFEDWGATGPSYPGNAQHTTEWFFDFDAELTSGMDAYYIDYERSGVRTAIRRTSPGEEVYLNGAEIYEVKTGIQLYNTGTSYIYNYDFLDIESPDKYGGAIRIGNGASQPTVGITYIKNVKADGKEAPLSSYSTSNTDFIAVERESAPVYIQYATAKNFSDAIVDNKSTVYIMNATFEDAHRVLRVWNDAEIVIVNSIINSAPGEDLLWLGGTNAKISYYNVLWNGETSPDPSLIAFDNGSSMANITELTENPLPAMSTFFELEIATVSFETSLDGETWTVLENGSFGSADGALRGDVRFDLDIPQGNTILVRALVETTDGSQALTGAMEFDGSDSSVTVDLADFQFGDTGGPADPPADDPVPPADDPVPPADDPVPPADDPVPPADGDDDDAPNADLADLVAAINVGGSAYTSVESGIVYSADPGISGGYITYSDRSGNSISGTEDDRLYQTYGYGDFSYDIAVPEDGVYVVRIELNEPWFGSSGKRLFDVDLEGSAAGSFADIDPYALAGDFEAYTLSKTVTVTDGILDIDFDPSTNYAIVSAISVFKEGTTGQDEPPVEDENTAPAAADDTFTLAEDLVLSGVNVLADNGGGADSDADGDTLSVSLVSDVSNGALVLNSDGSFTYTPDADYSGEDSFTYQASDGNGGTDDAVVTLNVTPVDDPEPPADDPIPPADDPAPTDDGDDSSDTTDTDGATLIAAINVGGRAYTSVESGIDYAADPGISDGNITYRDRARPVSGTDDDALYQTYGFGDFSYDIIVPEDGEYVVQIDLTEPWFKSGGQRLFDVELEGSAFGSFSDIDPYAVTGGKFEALTLTETVTVTDGVLDIDFDPSLNNALVSAITVFQEDALL